MVACVRVYYCSNILLVAFSVLEKISGGIQVRGRNLPQVLHNARELDRLNWCNWAHRKLSIQFNLTRTYDCGVGVGARHPVNCT